MNPSYNLLFKGKKYSAFVDDSLFWTDFKFVGEKFLIKSSLANNKKRFQKEYDKFCKNSLKKIIDKRIRKLLGKTVRVKINYTKSNGEGFTENKKMSAEEYIKLRQFNKTEIIIDLYEGLWGSNYIDKKNKNYVLKFNLNLIKYGNEEQIIYVMAHEIAHIFYRDHGNDFFDLLKQYTGWGERKMRDYWNSDYSKNVL